MLKFDFSLLTRDGQKVESIVIAAKDQVEAERKLRQMYRYCEVLTCNAVQQGRIETPSKVLGSIPVFAEKQPDAASLEDILTLISK